MKLLYHILIITLMAAPLAQAQSFWEQYIAPHAEKAFKIGVVSSVAWLFYDRKCLKSDNRDLKSQVQALQEAQAESQNKINKLDADKNSLSQNFSEELKDLKTNFSGIQRTLEILNEKQEKLEFNSRQSYTNLEQKIQAESEKREGDLNSISQRHNAFGVTLANCMIKIKDNKQTTLKTQRMIAQEVDRLRQDYSGFKKQTNQNFAHQKSQIKTMKEFINKNQTILSSLKISLLYLGNNVQFLSKNPKVTAQLDVAHFHNHNNNMKTLNDKIIETLD